MHVVKDPREVKMYVRYRLANTTLSPARVLAHRVGLGRHRGR